MDNKIQIVLLVLILLFGFTARLYRFSNPIADWFSWRQVDTSAVSRNFIKTGFDVFHPRYDDISNIQTGYDNPNGYRFLEFPIFNIFQAGFYKLFDYFTLEEWGRLVTIMSSLLSIVFLYLLGKRYANWIVGLSAALFFAIAPYSIYYGRVILPDPMMAMAVLGGIYFFDLGIGKNEKLKYKNYILLCISIIFISVSLLLKPYAVFFTLPFFYIAWKRFGIGLFKQWQLWVFLITSVFPLILWRLWESHYPEGIASYIWLFNGGNIRFTGAYFYWIFAERISKLILAYWGLPIVLLGFLGRRKNLGFFLSFALSSLIYLIIIARGNVQHDYYQILIVPTLALLFGLGADFLLKASQTILNKFTSYLLLTVCLLFMSAFGWYQVRDYFNINNPAIITAGQYVDKTVPKDAKVIAPLDGDTTFLYYTNRKGWPAYEKDPAELIKKGADYLVLLHPSQADFTRFNNYRIVKKTREFVLFNLL